MRHGTRVWQVAAPVLLGWVGTAMAGPDWAEIGDAGDKLPTAQVPFGPGATLNSISGVLTGAGVVGDFADCYLIRIVTPTLFSATVTSADFNPQLFLFNISVPGGAFGLLANDDQSGANNLPKFTNLSTDGTNVIVALPGDYMLGISGNQFHPFAPSGPGGQTGRVFNYASATEVSGPDGPGGFNQYTEWQGTGVSGNYHIVLTGAGFPSTPAPGTATLLLAAGAVAARRRR